MGSMHRTQIYLDNSQMAQLRLAAQQAHLTVSELIRRAIAYLLENQDKDINWDRDPVTRTVGKVKLTDRAASMKHDHYLYGKQK